MKEELELMADHIETALLSHKISARVTGGTVTPRWVRFQVLPAVGAKVSEIKGLSAELAVALNAPKCRVSRCGAAVAVEVPRDDPQSVRLLPLFSQFNDDHHQFPSVTAILGLAEDGAPLLIRLPSPDVEHILITGQTGAGKTMLLQAIVLSLAMTNNSEDLAFVFLGDGLSKLAQAVQRFGFLVYRIERLGITVVKAAIRTAGKRIIIVADDLVGGENSAKKVKAHLATSGMHHYVVAWNGIPPAGVAEVFKARLVGRVANSSEARLASGLLGTGAERLAGQGDFLAIAEGRVIRFQAAHVSPKEVQEMVVRLAAQEQADE